MEFKWEVHGGCHLLNFFSNELEGQEGCLSSTENKSFTQPCFSASPLSSVHSQAFLQSHTIFTSRGFWLQSVPGKHCPICWGCVCLRQLSLAGNEAVLSFICSYSWVHPPWLGSHRLRLAEPLGFIWWKVNDWKDENRVFLIAKPLESIGNSACYYVWSPWNPIWRMKAAVTSLHHPCFNQ